MDSSLSSINYPSQAPSPTYQAPLPFSIPHWFSIIGISKKVFSSNFKSLKHRHKKLVLIRICLACVYINYDSFAPYNSYKNLNLHMRFHLPQFLALFPPQMICLCLSKSSPRSSGILSLQALSLFPVLFSLSAIWDSFCQAFWTCTTALWETVSIFV